MLRRRVLWTCSTTARQLFAEGNDRSAVKLSVPFALRLHGQAADMSTASERPIGPRQLLGWPDANKSDSLNSASAQKHSLQQPHMLSRQQLVDALISYPATDQRAHQLVTKLLAEHAQVRTAHVNMMVGICVAHADVEGLRACILLAAARQLPLATSWFVGLLKALAMEQRHRLERGKLMVVRNYDLHACRGVLTEMRVLGVPPDAHIFGMLAAVHVAYNDLPRAEEYWRMAMQGDCVPGMDIFHAMIQAYIKRRAPQQAEALVHEACNLHQTKGSAHLWSMALNAWARLGRVHDMERVLADMRAANIPESDYIHGIRIEAYRIVGDHGKAREVLEEAKAAGVRPNAVMYTSLLNAYGRAGQLQSAADVFREMQQDGVQPPARAYTSLMYWRGEQGQVAQVHQLLAGMQAAGIVITNGDWNAAANGLMTCWCHAGRPPALLEAAWTLFLRRTCPADFMPCSALDSSWPRALCRDPKVGLMVDVHGQGPWSAQLAVLVVLQRLLEGYTSGEQFPMSDLKILTGRGHRSQPRFNSSVRTAVLKFLQGFASPKLAERNEGMIVLRRANVLHLLGRMAQSSCKFDAQTFAMHFAA